MYSGAGGIARPGTVVGVAPAGAAPAAAAAASASAVCPIVLLRYAAGNAAASIATAFLRVIFMGSLVMVGFQSEPPALKFTYGETRYRTAPCEFTVATIFPLAARDLCVPRDGASLTGPVIPISASASETSAG